MESRSILARDPTTPLWDLVSMAQEMASQKGKQT
jgi:hypothetical protein